MATYLKMEEKHSSDTSLKDDFMGISLLALLLSPLALFGVYLSAIGMPFMTHAWSLTAMLVLLAAIPEAIQISAKRNLTHAMPDQERSSF